MFCPRCGMENSDASSFCKNCGTALGASANPASPHPNGAAPQAYTARPPRPAQEGCLGAAWKDLTSSPGWIKQVLILCLVGCVPILNFAVEGYAVRWGRELSFGKRESMPTQIFTKKEISTGFFACLVRLAVFSAVLIAGAAVALLIASMIGTFSFAAGMVVIFIVAFLAIVALIVFFGPLADVSVMRMSVVGYLESAFNFPKTLKNFGRAPGSAIAASIVPPLLIGVVQGIVSLISSLIVAVSARAAIASYYGGYDYYGYYGSTVDPSMIIEAITHGAFAILLIYFIVSIVSSMLSTFASLFRYRAIGHWTARNAPEWAEEAETLESK